MTQRLKDAWRASSMSAWNAGLIAVIISLAGPMTLVLQAADAGGLDPSTTVSWVWAASVCTGIVTIVMSLTMRLPMIAAWSIPGSVLLIDGMQRYDIHDLVGVYIAVGAISVVLSITGVFSRLINLVPSGVTNGILAGILLPICLRAASASEDIPVMALVMLFAFLIVRRIAPLFAVPAAMFAGIVTLVTAGGLGSASLLESHGVVAHPVWLTPSFDAGALLSIGVPLLLVTMAGQNLPAIDMMRGFGYRFHANAALTVCNFAGIAFAPFGLHAANLATATGVVCAGPESHPARSARYIAGISAGTFYLIAGIFAPVIVTFMAMISAPALALLAGLVLLPTLTTSFTTLVRQPNTQSAGHSTPGLEAGIVALVVTASEITLLGVTSPCWGLAAGVLVYFLLSDGKQRGKNPPTLPTQASTTLQNVAATSAADTAGRNRS